MNIPPFPPAVSPRHHIALEGGGWLLLHERWLEPGDADALERILRLEIPWRQERIRMFGRWIEQPRRMAAFADQGVIYSYSGLTLTPEPWSPALSDLRRRVEEACGASFNYVLANLYRGGHDGMGFHADDEPELGRNPLIASVSLGASRGFVLRLRKDPRVRVELVLSSGSLIMGGTTQHIWHHGVPRTARPVGPRINLTFRRVFPRG
ncbi:MAG: alpha-ketoglutarate-dependent dioxygenase AlkB [Polyangiaceae bacterium]|nr:alpha-ketoglutarate-dependent dioxygenase AlkB [Polyangiaceae bacterium]